MDRTMQRKHRDQMSHAEIDFVESTIHAMDNWTVESGLIHASRRGYGRTNFGRDEVADALKTGQVIEVNSCGRVLMRSAKGICVVASVSNHLVITVWFNRPNDKHKTLRREEYQWKVNVIEYVTGLHNNRLAMRRGA